MDERAEIVSAIYRGILQSVGRVADCFNPRHGIRASQGERTVDRGICYESLSLQIHGSGGERSQALTGAIPTDLWRRHGLDVHPDR